MTTPRSSDMTTPRSSASLPSSSDSDSDTITIEVTGDNVTINFPDNQNRTKPRPIGIPLSQSQKLRVKPGIYKAKSFDPSSRQASPNPRTVRYAAPEKVATASSLPNFFKPESAPANKWKAPKRKRPLSDNELSTQSEFEKNNRYDSYHRDDFAEDEPFLQPATLTPLEKARRAVKNNELLPELEEVIIEPSDEEDHDAPAATNAAWEGFKKISLYLLAFITALPTAINSLAMASGMPPEKLGREWLEKMLAAIGTFLYSIINMLSSLGINSIMNYLFIPTAWQRFSNSFKHTFDGPKEFFDNSFSVILGLGAALAAAVIGYNAFLWLPQGALAGLGLPVSIPAIIPALISALITLTTRYVGVTNILKRIHNLYSKDVKAQAEFAHALNHIDQAHINELHIRFESALKKLEDSYTENGQQLDPYKPLTKEDLEFIAHELANELVLLAGDNPDLNLMDGTENACLSAECIARNAALFFDLVFAVTLVGVPAGLTFMEKGWKGAETIASFTSNDITGWKTSLKRGVGFFPGLASAMLYADSASKIRNTLYDLSAHLWENPKDIRIALPILIANGFAASSAKSLAAGVFNNPKNITGIHDPYSTSSAIILNVIGGFVVNTKSTLEKALPIPYKDAAHITEEDIVDYLSRVTENQVQHETADIFKDFLETIHPSPDSDNDQLRRSSSLFLN